MQSLRVHVDLYVGTYVTFNTNEHNSKMLFTLFRFCISRDGNILKNCKLRSFVFRGTLYVLNLFIL